MADFNRAVELLLRMEGGFHPSDAEAGSVNYGITERFLRSINYPKLPKDLTLAEAVKIYKKYFWDAHLLGSYADQRLATAVFVCIVNAGPYRVKKIVGNFLPLRKLTGKEADEARKKLIDGMRAFYRRLASRYPEKYGKYLAGWEGRLNAL